MTTTTQSTGALSEYQWAPQPKAEEFVDRLAREFLARSPLARKFAGRLYNRAAVRFNDLIDCIHAPRSTVSPADLSAAGFVRRPVPGAQEHYVQEQGIFPAIVIADSFSSETTNAGPAGRARGLFTLAALPVRSLACIASSGFAGLWAPIPGRSLRCRCGGGGSTGYACRRFVGLRKRCSRPFASTSGQC